MNSCTVRTGSDGCTTSTLAVKPMREIGAKTKPTGERLAVMTAHNLAHELLSIKLPGGFDLQEFRRRIAAMQSRLDEAMASQEQLF